MLHPASPRAETLLRRLSWNNAGTGSLSGRKLTNF